MEITQQKVQYQRNPIGVDTTNPHFEWNVRLDETADEKKWFQTAYQILVSDNKKSMEKDEGNIWDSGKQGNRQMTQILYGGQELQSCTRYYWKVRVWDQSGKVSAYSPVSYFETAFLSSREWTGKWIGEQEDFVNHIFRKAFQLKEGIKEARIYICGMGHYELLINGERTGDSVLAPGWTDYHKSCLYNTYDVTKQVQKGWNCIGLFLGDGMFHVKKKRYVYFERTYGNMKFLLQLQVTYEDGTRDVVVSDEKFHMAQSPVTYSGIYGGEDYDARLEQEGFSRSDFRENNSWQQAKVVAAPKGKLRGERTNPLKIMETLKPVKVWEVSAGIYMYDLGKNFSGWVSMKVRAGKSCAGACITLVPAEILHSCEQRAKRTRWRVHLATAARVKNPVASSWVFDLDGSPDQRVTGDGYCWKYICNEKEIQYYRPKFTYYGFRYVQVSGAVPAEFAADESRPVIEGMTGEFIYPDIERTGSFDCSSGLFNNIHQIIDQAVRSNMKSILTDCPHREKLGWLEQTHLIGPGIMCGYDVRSLYEKIEEDMAEAQHEDGLVPDICPEYVTGFEKWHPGYLDSPEWGSACIINPWYLYKRYADKSVLDRYYQVMVDYLDHLTRMTHHHILHHGLGDWLDIGPNTPHSQNTPVPVIATAVYYYDISIMEAVSKLLGKEKEEEYYRVLGREVKREFNLQFYDKATCRYATGSQAAQAMSLVVGLAEPENQGGILAYLVQDIEKRNYATTAGDIGHPYVMAALTAYGRSDIIEKMTNVTNAPGYGYQVRCGATTLTEEWDGPDPARPHGSQNHLMLGSAEEWFYCGLAGLPGVRSGHILEELVISPYFSNDLNYVRASTGHPYGKVSSGWMREQGKIRVEVEVPPNTTGILKLHPESEGIVFYGKETFIIPERV